MMSTSEHDSDTAKHVTDYDGESYTIEGYNCLENDVKTLASIQGMLITSLNVCGLLNNC